MESRSQTQVEPMAVSPLPARQYLRFIMFFHVVFLGGLAVSLFLHWRRPDVTFGPGEVVLLGLVGLQTALYLCFFVRPTLTDRWPSMPWWGTAFGVSAVVWLVESHLEPAFSWALGAYLGQILALSWRISVPISLGLCGCFFADKFGWSRISNITAWEAIIVLGSVAAWIALGLFLHSALATSKDRAKLILELESAKRELENSRQRDAELATLRERERLARELHDTLGHALVTLSVQLEAAKKLQAIDPSRTQDLMDEMLGLTRSCMTGLRQSLANLRDHGLQGRPLHSALEALCVEASKRSSIGIACAICGEFSTLPVCVAEALWRVAQEAVVNIEKHSHARQAGVSLSRTKNEIVLRLTDEGTGLPTDAESKPGHYGLRGMRERIEGLGGTLTITSLRNGGTTVEARVTVIS